MKFSEVVAQAIELLYKRGRVSYRALQEEFALTDKQLDSLKEELLFSQPQVSDADGRGLVWTEGNAGGSGQAAGQEGRSPTDAGGDLQLVHRGG